MRILALLVTLLLAACSPANTTMAPDTRGVPLAFGLVSFSSKATVHDTFVKGHRTEVIEDSSLAPNDPRPPFSIYTLRVLDVSDKGIPGRASLFFFNDRLVGVWFYPDDVSAYRSLMPVELGRQLDPQVEAWTMKDHRGHWYVAWEDKRLRTAMSDWLYRHS